MTSARRSRSADSPPQSQNSAESPEAFSPTDFFVAEASQPPEYAQTSSFAEMDAMGLGIDGGGDPRMYADVLAMFNDGSADADAGHMFGPGATSPGGAVGVGVASGEYDAHGNGAFD